VKDRLRPVGRHRRIVGDRVEQISYVIIGDRGRRQPAPLFARALQIADIVIPGFLVRLGVFIDVSVS